GTLPRLGLHIGEHHMRTLLREAPRRAGANPARRTRDKRDLVIEHAHGSYILSGVYPPALATGGSTPCRSRDRNALVVLLGPRCTTRAPIRALSATNPDASGSRRAFAAQTVGELLGGGLN